jgi:hypothetical protein
MMDNTTIAASDDDTDLLTNINEGPEGGVGVFPPDENTPHGVPQTVGTADPGCLEEEQQDPAPSNYTTGLEELCNLAQLKDIKLTMKFIRAMDGASLDNEHSQLDADTLHCLWNLPTSCVDLTDLTCVWGWTCFSQVSSLHRTPTPCPEMLLYDVTLMMTYLHMIR